MSATNSTTRHASVSIAQVIGDVARQLGMDENSICRLIEPKECIRLRLSPKLRDGAVHNITAFITRHSTTLGPSKGGIRMASSVSEDTIRTLAMEMTLKTALIDVPFGGGKAGICTDSTTLHPDDKETIIRSFANHARRHIGPELYVPAPDIGTGEREMGYIKDSIAYGEGAATTRGCYVTGKPPVLGGIAGRREATGYGVVITLQRLAERIGLKLSSSRVIVQGFGNVGSVAAHRLVDLGAAVVAISDQHGAIEQSDGIDVLSLLEHTERTDTVVGFQGARSIEPESIYDLDCDIFIPAAIGNVLNHDRASRVRATVIAEAANGPTTPDGDAVIQERGITAIPDILCNAGGVFVSYLEYTQETQRDQWSLEDVNNRLIRRMSKRFDDVWNLAESKSVTTRQAAMTLAISRLMEGMRCKGFLT